MRLINKGKILRTFDKDAINFIDAAGLDNDANLNVSGLYTAEQARMAVHMLISGLKKIKDIGQTTSVWDRMNTVHYFITGMESSHRLNFKTPTTDGSSGYVAFNSSVAHGKYGIRYAGLNSVVVNIPYNVVGGSQGSSHVTLFSKSNRVSTNQGDFYASQNEVSSASNVVSIESNFGGITYCRMYHALNSRPNAYNNGVTTGLIALSCVNNNTVYSSINGKTLSKISGIPQGSFNDINGLPRFGYWGNAGPSDKMISFQSIGHGITESESSSVDNLIKIVEASLNRLLYD